MPKLTNKADGLKLRTGRAGNGSMRELRLLERVGALILESEDLKETLESVVGVVADRMRTEVCSLYLLDDKQLSLKLWATTGLDRDAIGRVEMRTDEGLTGLVIENMEKVVAEDAPIHPRFKFFPELGEERYHSFLGVPVLERHAPLGVLVVQTLRRRSFTGDEVSLLRTIAGQIASVLVKARLLDSLKLKEREQADYRRRMLDALRRLQAVERQGETSAVQRAENRDPGQRLRGIGAAPGFGIGNAHILHPEVVLSEIADEPVEGPDEELVRFESAVAQAIADVQKQSEKMEEILPEATGKIFEAYLLMLQDDTLASRVRDFVAAGSSAEYSIRLAIEEFLEVFEQVDDPYLRERALDIRDVGQRLLRILLGLDTSLRARPGKGSVLIARELTLTDLSEIDLMDVQGIALATGGETSHATILAKSFEIPTVVGIDQVLEGVSEGDHVIVDGNAGVVYRMPGPDVVSEYERMDRDYRDFNENLGSLHDLPATTTDGRTVALNANVGLVGDVVLANRHGAEGVGLYRTEFPFISFRDFPSEQEQYDIYCKVIRGMGGRSVTVRTLDIGADKYPAFLHTPREENPFLGWRSIRVSLEMPEFFGQQLRAIMRAGVEGPTRILLPMISSVEEVLQAREIIENTRSDLLREGIPCVPDLPLGVMIEVPSAVYLAPQLVQYADFLSIGTNDLIQYLLAVDRNNRKVAPLYQPLHPAVLGTVSFVVESARAAGVPVSMCGEMAADPMCTLPLLGMGIDELSMEPFFIPVIKKLIRSVSQESAQALAEEVLSLGTSRDIKRAVFDAMREQGLLELLEMYQ
ncbi:MAG: phosphoenolpyruvate--protein phosphotransferase [Candidatus Binatia bacterium]|nr:phosphoenolpyruvate--protein phosphotransferase [Candidatus Binatia bacterium]MDG2009056.1 phosphoenolpyruvate--protein phosphotransferase [Candidatus Binatia bacterium]